jgi:hypothetical protein
VLTRVVVVLAALAGASLTASGRNGPDPVTEWNRIALAVTTPQGPIPQMRTMAIVHAAIHDAVNGITRQYRTYLPTGPVPRDASPAAAAIAAAHRTLTHLFPARRAAFGEARARSLAAHGLRESDPGVAFGEAAASAVLARQSQDGFAQADVPYGSPGARMSGAWVPVGDAPAVLPGLGKVTPWILRSAAQFRPGRPPALDGATYAREYNELKTIGSRNRSSRTREQTAIARFWLAAPSEIWNDVAGQALAARPVDLSATARVLALLYLAAADASIACWDAKYTYAFWRPITAIRSGDADGNEATTADPLWQPLAETHQHPEYPSGHTTNSAAMATVLAAVFGETPGIRLVATSPTHPGFRRTWSTFEEGVDEVIDARVYAGVHFRTSNDVGARLGRQVAQFVMANALQPVR